MQLRNLFVAAALLSVSFASRAATVDLAFLLAHGTSVALHRFSELRDAGATSNSVTGLPGAAESIRLAVSPSGVAVTPGPGTFALRATGALSLGAIVRRRFVRA